jgi:metal-dependent amidase/aminoacylase/carboxypeptidase family protein
MLTRVPAIILAVSILGGTTAPTLGERVETVLTRRAAATIDFRRDLHRHPELSGAEQRTSAAVAARLRALGLDVRTGVGGHGVVGILRGGRSGPLVAYRADMDAVPSDALDPVAFASEVPGVRHICGHDLHTAIGIALAEGFAAIRRDLPGSIMFVFQPAEERAVGAKAMLDAGLFARETPVAIYALHTAPFPVGVLATRAGGLMAGRDEVSVRIEGTGDLERVAADVRQVLEKVGTVTDAQSVAPAPPDFVYAQVGRVERRGTALLVNASLTMADSAVRERTRTRVLAEIGRLTSAGVRVAADYHERQIAGVTNHAALTQRANAAIASRTSGISVIDVTQILPAFSEDFGSFQARVPGVFYFLGVANAAKGWSGMPHSPDYVADEAAMLIGARSMAAVLLERLGAQ